jgi:hypothetical protein
VICPVTGDHRPSANSDHGPAYSQSEKTGNPSRDAHYRQALNITTIADGLPADPLTPLQRQGSGTLFAKGKGATVAGRNNILQEDLEAFRIGRRHDQIDASSIVRSDGAAQVDVFADALAGDLRLVEASTVAWRFMRPKGASAANMMSTCNHHWPQPPGLPHSVGKAVFFKAF